MSLNDLMSFWGEKTPIAKKAAKATAQSTPYKLPEVVFESDGMEMLVFEDIGKKIIRENALEMEATGFLDLDKLWGTSSNDPKNELQSMRDFEYEESTLLKTFPTPFSGRKAYLIKILMETKTDTTPEGPKEKKVLYRLSVSEKNETKRMCTSGRIIGFHNKDMGWNENAKDNKKTVKNASGTLVQVEDEEAYPSVMASFWMEDLVFHKLANYIKPKIEGDPKLKELMVFALATGIKKSLKDKDAAPKTDYVPNDYWWTLNVDDFFFV